MTVNDAGPIAEPWITLARMSAKSDILPSNLVQCEWPLKKSLIQLYIASGKARRAIFSMSVACLTVSKALLKSSAKTRTNGCVDNMLTNAPKQRDEGGVCGSGGSKRKLVCKV